MSTPWQSFYQNQLVRDLISDLIVDEKVIVDPKSWRHLMKRMSHKWQVI
jgi:PD-(D/E)XK nuclease superfamily